MSTSKSLVRAMTVMWLFCACGNSRNASAGAGTATGFIALNSNFADYETWDKFDISNGFVGSSHLEGPRTVYIKPLPAKGSTSFPVGTIIVKQTRNGEKAAWEVHAMVKRGNDFNAEGTTGWEWFDLRHNPDGIPLIRWRGEAAPVGETYQVDGGGTVVAGDCNGCHREAVENDFVKSNVLQLSSF